jgi:hypothetical protein
MTTAFEGGEGVSVTPQPLFTLGKDSVPIVQEAGWAPGPVWIGAENLAPTGIRSRTVQHVTSGYTYNLYRYTIQLPVPHIGSFLERKAII